MHSFLGLSFFLSFLQLFNLNVAQTLFDLTNAVNVLQALAEGPDVTTSGNYLIINCDFGEEGSRAAMLLEMLPTFNRYLENVNYNVQEGRSSGAYAALFKADANKDKVKQVFQKISSGISINGNRPTLACLKDTDRSNAPLIEACGLDPNIIAHAVDSHFIALCEAFWQFPEKSVARDCPTVNNNKFPQFNARLMISRFALFVRAAATLYLSAMLDAPASQKIEIQGCVDLSAEESLGNPSNYGFYASGEWAASEFWFLVDIFHIAVTAGCSHYPITNIPEEDIESP